MDTQKLRLIFDAMNESAQSVGGFNQDDHPLQFAALEELRAALESAPPEVASRLKSGQAVPVSELPRLQEALGHALSRGAVSLNGAVSRQGGATKTDCSSCVDDLALRSRQKLAAREAFAKFMGEVNRDDPMRMECSSSAYERQAIDRAVDAAFECASEQCGQLRGCFV